MDVLKHLMELYDEALEELMGAQSYAKKYIHAHSPEEKNMYRTMSKQELEHAATLVHRGNKLVEGSGSTESLNYVWASLKQHVEDWHRTIEQMLE